MNNETELCNAPDYEVEGKQEPEAASIALRVAVETEARRGS
jgi:hypothetical protein